jgi:hypothetical protein
VLPKDKAEFQAGSVDFAHTWFQARKDVSFAISRLYSAYPVYIQRLVDAPGPSRTLSKPQTARWIEAVTDTEASINDIFSLIAPQLHSDGIRSLQRAQANFPTHPGISSWPSKFNGISVIVNRKTVFHRDSGGRPEWYDLLFAAGTYKRATLDIPDIGARFDYNPGTVIALCGRVFRHGVVSWDGGERICYAHYMRNNVLHRQGMKNSSWVEEKDYKEWMSTAYLHRQAKQR